jgi:hypothetical protein
MGWVILFLVKIMLGDLFGELFGGICYSAPYGGA